MKNIILSVLTMLLLIQRGNAADLDTLSGKALFQKNCTSCHAVQTRIVGPALMNVFDRHSEAWIIKFVHSSQTVIRSGDTSAIEIFTKFNQTIMPDHPNLNDQDIRDILGYIKNDSKGAIAQSTAITTVEDNDPYKGKSGLVRHVVYFDLPGTHLPISPDDYRTWILMVGLISMSLLALFIIIKAKSLIAYLNKKYDSKDNHPEEYQHDTTT